MWTCAEVDPHPQQLQNAPLLTMMKGRGAGGCTYPRVARVLVHIEPLRLKETVGNVAAACPSDQEHG